MRSAQKTLLATAVVAALATPTFSMVAQAAPSQKAKVLSVTSGKDDGSRGTLRWALEQSNTTSAVEHIEITKSAGIIKVKSVLPAITAPVVITGATSARGGAPVTGIDGSSFIDTSTYESCPGWTSGAGPNARSVASPGLQVVDSGNVVISGLAVRNFCIGILSLRSHDNTFTRNAVSNNVGAAGIEVTGDDGLANPTTGLSVRNTVSDNVFRNNGDAMEFTRGTSDGHITGNTFITDSDAPGGLLPSQSIEFAGSGDDRNVVSGNRFLGGMSDGLQISGTGNVVKGNLFRGYANAIDANGTDLRIEKNTITGNHQGINTTQGAGLVVSGNSIYGNGAPVSLCNSGGICDTNAAYATAVLGIDLGAKGPDANDALDADTVQNHPVLGFDTDKHGVTRITGVLDSKPLHTYRVELFSNERASKSGYGEGQFSLATVRVTTDAEGHGTFSYPVPSKDRHALVGNTPWIAATATDLAAGGSTSEFSAALRLN